MPKGLEYVDSWVEPNCSRCFQLMRCDDPRLFQEKTRDAGAVDLGRHGQFAIEAAIDDDLASLPDLRVGGKKFRRHAPDEIGSLEPVGVDGGQRNQEGRPNHGRPKGAALAAEVRLDSVSVGPIVMQNVRALVARPGALDESLLGMSFLERLKGYTVERGRLILTAK